MMKKLIIIILAVSVLAACAIHRFESIDTCEFETRDFLTMNFWTSSNCLGLKDQESHTTKTVKGLQEILHDDTEIILDEEEED